MAGWPRHDPSRLGGLGVGCALPAALGRPHRLVGFYADGPVPLHGLVFGPTLGQPE